MGGLVIIIDNIIKVNIHSHKLQFVTCFLVCLFGFLFHIPVNSYGHVKTVS